MEWIEMMKTILIMGTQFGDEGKGAVAHMLAKQLECDFMVRFNGGANAGHTVVDSNDDVTKFNQLPSGANIPGVISVIANGSVVDVEKLCDELERNQTKVIIISKAAHVVLPRHIKQEYQNEADRGVNKIGSIGTGNGPCYADKMLRTGVTMGQFVRDPRNRQMVNRLHSLGVWVTDTRKYLQNYQEKFDGVMILEGAHGWELDIDHGDYPYVTSSNCGVGGAATGTGLDPRKIDHVLGVVKAYSTRVGNGSFPDAMHDHERVLLRWNHAEVGTVSGRQRRVDWIDLDRLQVACVANGVDSVVLTHVDALAGLDRVKAIYNQKVVTFKGWHDISECRTVSDLPKSVMEFIRGVESKLGVPVYGISIGPREDQFITQ